MSDIGKIGWIDLTCADASGVKNFYAAVAGWHTSAVPVGDYEDYCVHPAEGADPVAGICHKRGSNSEIPTQWMMYINVANLDESMQQCESLGGKVVCPVRDMGSYGRLCIIQDPAGAVAGLIEPPQQSGD